MKKSLHTVLTAAAFALSMNNATVMPTGAAEKNVTAKSSAEDIVKVTSRPEQPAYGTLPAYETTTSSVEDIVTTTNMMTYPAYGTIQPYTTTSTVETIINQFTTTVETVYGPPAWFTSTTTTEDIINTTTTMLPQPAYGVMNPIGDLNYDYRIDSSDLITLRKIILNGGSDYSSDVKYSADINKDGEIGIADLISLQNFILGRYTTRDEMYNPEIPDVTTLIETFTTTTAVLYGPPWVFPDYTGTIPDWALNPTTQTTVEEE